MNVLKTKFAAWIIYLPLALSQMVWILQYYNEPFVGLSFGQLCGMAGLKMVSLTWIAFLLWCWYEYK